MSNTIRSKIERLADRRMWRYEMGEIIWRGETPDGNEIETDNPVDLLNEILVQLDNLPAVAWSIGHDENGEDGIITREAGHAQNWRDRCQADDRVDDDSVLSLYPLDMEPRND